MGRYRGPSCKLCRREGKKLFLKGEKCNTDKCVFQKRSTPPGEMGKYSQKRKPSGYSIHLREKQIAKHIYGCGERQFKNYFKMASRKKGSTGETFLQFLERRLDNVVYRTGIAPSRRAARQLITHGHILVNNRKVDIPSFLVKPECVITVAEKSKEMPMIKKSLEQGREIPSWLSFDKENLSISVRELPKREDIKLDIKEQLIVELYSK